MPRPNAIEASLRFRRQLAQQEATSAERMGNIWLGILRRLTPQFEALADDVAAMEKPTKGRLTRLARFQRIMRQIAEQATRFGATVTTEVELIQNAAIQAGLDNALRLMELSLPPLPNATSRQLVASFTRLPAEAVISAAGLLGDDSPLADRLQQAYGQFAAKQFEEHLLDGIAAGQNPRRIASLLRRNVQAAGGTVLKSALTSIRTAQIKSYQIANHSQYAANPEIVPQWVWVSALQPGRTCMSCVNMHGTVHPYTETLNDHHNGLCSPVPKTITYAQLGINVAEPVPEIESGESWFERQPAARQREMMGPGKYDAYKANKFEFRELSLPYEDDVYGELLRERPLTGPNGLVGGKRRPPTPPREPEPEPTEPRRPIPREFSDPGGIRDFDLTLEELNELEAESDEWMAKLSEEEKAGVNYWSGSGYKKIRADVANGDLSDDNTVNFLRALEIAPETEQVTWRGIVDSVPGSFATEADEAVAIRDKWDRSIGTEILWTPPSSASISPNVSAAFGGTKRGVLFEIRSNRARYINAGSRFRGDFPDPDAGDSGDEYEAVIPAFTRLRVVEVKTVKVYDSLFDKERERLLVVLDDITED